MAIDIIMGALVIAMVLCGIFCLTAQVIMIVKIFKERKQNKKEGEKCQNMN